MNLKFYFFRINFIHNFVFIYIINKLIVYYYLYKDEMNKTLFIIIIDK